MKCRNKNVTGVKSSLFLAVIPNVKETHHNMKLLFELTELNKISFLFVTDFKLLLTVIGKQIDFSSFPCPYCTIHLRDLGESQNTNDNFDNTEIETDLEVINFEMLQIHVNREKITKKYQRLPNVSRAHEG